MIDLGADILCEGHFGVFRETDNVRQFNRSYLLRYRKKSDISNFKT